MDGEVEAVASGTSSKLVKFDFETSKLGKVELDVHQASTELYQVLVHGKVLISREMADSGGQLPARPSETKRRHWQSETRRLHST